MSRPVTTPQITPYQLMLAGSSRVISRAVI